MAFKTILTKKAFIDITVIAFLSIVVFILAGSIDLFEKTVEFVEQYEEYEIDELIIVALFLVIGLTYFAIQRWRDALKFNDILETTNRNLSTALSEIKQLKEIIPICSSCHNIMEDDGTWQRIEAYFAEHTDTKFSHGMCPDCARKLYPDLDLDDE